MKKTGKNLKEFVKENKLFSIAIVITIIFVLCPLWLKLSILHNGVSWVLKALSDQGFKSSYIETTGAILGTFLAVTGAVWTQRMIDTKVENEKKRECALIIFYDFEFAFEELCSYIRSYRIKANPICINVLEDEKIEAFRECGKSFKIYIHNEWIENVAKISRYFSNAEIKTIYEMYGDLETVRKIYDKPLEQISKSELKLAFKSMEKYCTFEVELRRGARPETEKKEKVNIIMNKIKRVGGLD